MDYRHAAFVEIMTQFVVKALGNETRRTGRDVDVFADQITVHPRQKIVCVEVDVFVAAIELGGQ